MTREELSIELENGIRLAGWDYYPAKFIGDNFFIKVFGDWVEADTIDFEIEDEKKFHNGFVSWHETHFDIVSRISLILDNDLPSEIVHLTQEHKGRGGLYQLACELADEFEELHFGREWDGDYVDTIEDFLDNKLK